MFSRKIQYKFSKDGTWFVHDIQIPEYNDLKLSVLLLQASTSSALSRADHRFSTEQKSYRNNSCYRFKD